MNASTSNQDLPPLLDLDPIVFDGGKVRVPTDSSFWNFDSAFGGWVAAVVVEVLGRHPEFRGEVIAQQMQFMGPVKADAVDVSATLVSRRSSVDFWRAEVTDPDGAILVSADVSCGQRRATGIGFEESGPEFTRSSGSLMAPSEMYPKWTRHFEQVVIEGELFTVAERPRTVVAIRPERDVAFGPAVLAMICDSPMPRTFFASTDFSLPSTLSLSTHIYASNEDVEAVGREFVLLVTDSSVIRNNTLNQEVHVYREDGLLLACSYQTAVFREPLPRPDQVNGPGLSSP